MLLKRKCEEIQTETCKCVSIIEFKARQQRSPQLFCFVFVSAVLHWVCRRCCLQCLTLVVVSQSGVDVCLSVTWEAKGESKQKKAVKVRMIPI